jgi:translation initiation factor IF-2
MQAVTLDNLFGQMEQGKLKQLNLIVKADVQGSVEALKQSLEKLSNEEVRVKVIHSAAGAVTESDVTLAKVSNAIIIGFNVRPSSKTLEVAKEYNVDIRLHNIIYKLVEEIEDAMKGMLDPEYEEKIIGTAEVRKLFKFSKVGTIAGSMVTDGIIKSDAKARLIRDGVVVYDGQINTIQKEKDQAKEVKQGFECGITLVNFSDIKEGDIIEAYEMVEIKR